MEKRISFFEFQSIKAVAKAIDPLVRKQNELKAQISKLAEEYKKKQEEINAYESGVVSILGMHVDQLVKKVIESGEDKNGKPVKTTKYLPTEIVTYDNEAKQYVISLPDESEPGEEGTNVAEDVSEAPAEEAVEESDDEVIF